MEVVRRYNEAFDAHDVDGIMAAMTEDCVFDSPGPTPDGTRFQGQASVRQVWEEFFGSSSRARFEAEEMFASGDRCVVRWIYTWLDEQGSPGHVRGVDIFTVEDGQVSEKLAYVKG